MPPRRDLTLPAAIVIAGALVGLGLYFGLRAQDRSASAAPPIAGAPGPAPEAEPDATTAVPVAGSAAPTAPQPDRDAVTETARTNLRAAFEAARPRIVDECWAPSAAAQPDPATMTIGVSISFRATGEAVASGIIEHREASRPDINGCLAAIVHGLKIPAPGINVTLEESFALP